MKTTNEQVDEMLIGILDAMTPKPETQPNIYFESEYKKLQRAIAILERSNSYDDNYFWKRKIQNRLREYIRGKALILSTLI